MQFRKEFSYNRFNGQDFPWKRETSEIYLPFRCFLCVRNETVESRANSDLLPNMSMVVSYPAVKISLALRARDISSLQLTSNQ